MSDGVAAAAKKIDRKTHRPFTWPSESRFRVSRTIHARFARRVFEWIAESFRSIAQRPVAVGVVKEWEFDVDVLEQPLRQVLASLNASIPGPPWWAALRGSPEQVKGPESKSTKRSLIGYS